MTTVSRKLPTITAIPTISAVATAIALTITEVRPRDAASPRAAMPATTPKGAVSHRPQRPSTRSDTRGEIIAVAPIRQTSARYPPTGIRSTGGTRQNAAVSTASTAAAMVERRPAVRTS